MEAAELGLEVCHGVEAAAEGDFGDGGVGFGEEAADAGDA